MTNKKSGEILILTLFQAIYRKTFEFGADAVGIIPAGNAETFPFFQEWLKQGNQASMSYLEKNQEARKNPCSILSTVRSMVVIAVSMDKIAQTTQKTRTIKRTPQAKNQVENQLPILLQLSEPTFIEESKISRCRDSQGRFGTILFYGELLDYHDVVRQTLTLLKSWITSQFPHIETRIAVDTAPLLEKEWGKRAGLGFIGRNSLLIHPKFGSRLFLGTLLLSSTIDELRSISIPKELFPNNKSDLNFSDKNNILSNVPQKSCFSNEPNPDCGKCQRCLEICPTGAILTNKTLDARRCLNYWTIEHKTDDIPQEIRQKLGHRLFGCDLCQRVCPWNRFEHQWQPKSISLLKIQQMSDFDFKQIFSKTPVSRIKCNGLKRNAQWLED